MAGDELSLPDENTDAGALVRVFLLETKAPSDGGYDREESLKAMRLMRRVIENRLASPSRYMARGATSDRDIIKLGNQFAGFRDYPGLPGSLAAKLTALVTAANSGRTKVRQFVEDAITVATEQNSTPAYLDVTAWRTALSSSPGDGFHFVITLQGNTFYATNPVPPVPHRHRAPGPLHAHGSHHRHRN